MRVRLALLLALAPGLAFALPDLTAPGPYGVGLRRITFTKRSVTTREPRTLETWIWYPAAPGTGTPASPANDLPVADGRWRLALFSHGLCGFPTSSAFLTAALASWGFVVAAPAHAGGTIADPGCATDEGIQDSFLNRVADVRSIADQLLAPARQSDSPFAGRLRRGRIGVLGHSFGGQTALRVAALDRRVRAAVALAPARTTVTSFRVKAPALVIAAELDTLTPVDDDARQSYGRLRGPRALVELLNAGHCAFAVACLTAACGAGCEPSAAPLAETHRLTLHYAIGFVLRYLAGQKELASVLDATTAPAGSAVLASARLGR